MKVGSTFKIVACVRIKILCPGIRLWLATPLNSGCAPGCNTARSNVNDSITLRISPFL